MPDERKEGLTPTSVPRESVDAGEGSGDPLRGPEKRPAGPIEPAEPKPQR